MHLLQDVSLGFKNSDHPFHCRLAYEHKQASIYSTYEECMNSCSGITVSSLLRDRAHLHGSGAVFRGNSTAGIPQGHILGPSWFFVITMAAQLSSELINCSHPVFCYCHSSTAGDQISRLCVASCHGSSRVTCEGYSAPHRHYLHSTAWSTSSLKTLRLKSVMSCSLKAKCSAWNEFKLPVLIWPCFQEALSGEE